MRSRCLVLLLALIIPFSGLMGATLTITKDGGGDGFIRVNGVDQTLPFSQSYAYGTSLTVEAVPATTGSQFDWWSGSALVNGTDNPVTFTMPLFGNVSVTANFSLSPPDIDSVLPTWTICAALVGSSCYNDISISNSGGQTLVVVSMSITGTNASEFFIANASQAFNLAAGASHTLTVGFTPVSSGDKLATLNITSNDPDENPFQVGLRAQGFTPDIASNPADWDFGPVSIGGHSDKTFAVRDDGDGILLVSSTVLTGSNASEFTIQGGGGSYQLDPGQSRDVTVRFTPTGTGVKSASLTFNSNDPDENPFHVGLSGTGTVMPGETHPDIASNPASWDYGAVNAGSYLDKTFVISNAGAAGLNVTAVTLSGADASEFHIQSSGGSFTLAPAATRSIVVRFTPSGSGGKSASLSFASNDPDENPFLVHLIGGGGTSIVVDGNKDSFYSTLTGPENGYIHIPAAMHNDNGAPDNEKDLSADLWVAWDPTYLYFYEEVKDNAVHLNNPTSWQNDGLEIYVDPDPGKGRTSGQLGFSMTALDSADVADPVNLPGVRDLLGNNCALGSTKADYARKKTADGYVLEGRVKWEMIKFVDGTWGPLVPAAGKVFGMSVMNHDNDVSAREGSITWAAVMRDMVWNDPRMHGTVTLQAGHKLKMAAQNAIVPANVNADAWAYVPVADLFRIAMDGEKDPWYNELTGPENGYIHIPAAMHNDNGAPDNEKDLSADLWVAWDDTYLYVYEEVKDNVVHLNNPTTWQNDCLEIYFDPDPSLGRTSGPPGFGLSALDSADTDPANYSGVAGMNAFSTFQVTKADYARRRTADGYALECRVKWDWIRMTDWGPVVPGVGKVFGMAVMNHDNDVSTREGSITWAAVMRDMVWNDPRMHGTVTFLDGHQLKLEAKNAIVDTIVNPLAALYVPSGLPWPMLSMDVGSVQKAGSASYDATTRAYTVSGSGADIWDKADGFQYAFQQVSGDVEYTAKIVSLTKSDPWTKGALMIRDGLTGNSAHAMMAIASDNGLTFQYRTGDGATSALAAGNNAIRPPYWLKIVRSGNTLIGTASADGASWVEVGRKVIAMKDPVYAGMAVTSHKNGSLSTGTFSDVTIQFKGVTGVEEIAASSVAPQGFALSQNYPNPFNPVTRLSYDIQRQAAVKITIYDVMGCEVETLVSQIKPAGRYTIEFDGSGLGSGIYFCDMQCDGQHIIRKMMLLK